MMPERGGEIYSKFSCHSEHSEELSLERAKNLLRHSMQAIGMVQTCLMKKIRRYARDDSLFKVNLA